MRRTVQRCLLFTALLALAPVQIRAQNAPTPSPTPAEQMLNEMLKPSPPSDASAPATRPQGPQVIEPAGYAAKPSNAHLLREGTDVIAQHGHLRKVPDSPYSQFVFDPSNGLTLQPMLVLPNLQLMSMENAAAATKKDLGITISGMVTEYRNQNYILLEPGPDAVSHQLPMQLSADAAARDSASPAPTPARSPDQMLKEMLSADKPASPIPVQASAIQQDATTGSAAVAPSAPVLAVLPEQSQIFDRVCRMSTSPDGQHEQLTFDSDGSALQDPPLIILPNLKLMDLEKVAADARTRLRVTGTVTEYRGRNYILLQKVVVMADSDRQF